MPSKELHSIASASCVMCGHAQNSRAITGIGNCQRAGRRRCLSVGPWREQIESMYRSRRMLLGVGVLRLELELLLSVGGVKELSDDGDGSREVFP